MKHNKKEIELFIIDYFIEKEGRSIIKIIKDIDLINEGYIDSLDVVKLCLDLQKRFNVKINPNTDETIEAFTKFNLLLDYVNDKVSSK